MGHTHTPTWAKFILFVHHKDFFPSLWSKWVIYMLSACCYDNVSVDQQWSDTCWFWLLNFCITATGRRSAPPLNLTGLPGTEKLNEREKEVQLSLFCVYRAFTESLRPQYASDGQSPQINTLVCVEKRNCSYQCLQLNMRQELWARFTASDSCISPLTDAQSWSHRLRAILL